MICSSAQAQAQEKAERDATYIQSFKGACVLIDYDMYFSYYYRLALFYDT